MVRPTTGRPCCWRRAATVEESTPPDMATATRPGCVSARSGSMSNCVAAFMSSVHCNGFSSASARGLRENTKRRVRRYSAETKKREPLVMSDSLLVGGGELAKLGDGGRDDLQGEVDVGLRCVASEAETQAGARFLGRQADGGEDMRRLDGAGRAGR